MSYGKISGQMVSNPSQPMISKTKETAANSESFATCFLIWIPLITFPALIAVTKTSKTILNSSGASGHPCLVRDLEKCFQFSTTGDNVC